MALCPVRALVEKLMGGFMVRYKTCRWYVVAAAMLVLSGCLSNPVSKSEYAEYRSAPLLDAEHMPTEDELTSRRSKVVVLEGEDGSAPSSREAGLGRLLSKAIAAKVSERGVEIIDPKLAPRLSDQLRIAESRGTSEYSGPAVANYAIKPTVATSSVNSRFVQGSEYTDKKGKVTRIPSSYTHSGEVTASVSIYSMPALTLMTSIPLNGSKSSTGNNSAQPLSAGVPLLEAAVKAAVEDQEHTLFNFFSGRGYVNSKKVLGKKSIFEVTVGKSDGLKPGDKVIFYSRRKTEGGGLRKNQVKTLEEIVVADGLVTDNMTDEEAWVYVSDEVKAKKIMRGDLVKPEHSGSLFKKVLRDSLGNL
jgi:hypothetical protein